jgi:chromosome segregation ATPase
MKKILLAPAVLLLSACWHNVVPPPHIPKPVPPPPKQEEATPYVEEVAKKLDQVQDENARLKTTAGKLKTSVTQARDTIDEMDRKLKELRARGAATAQELDDLWRLTQDMSARNLFMEIDIGFLSETVIAQEASLKLAHEAQAKAEDATAKKDKEAKDAQAKLGEANVEIENAGKQIVSQHKVNLALQQENQRLTAENASYKTFKRWTVGIGVTVVVLLILAIVGFIVAKAKGMLPW